MPKGRACQRRELQADPSSTPKRKRKQGSKHLRPSLLPSTGAAELLESCIPLSKRIPYSRLSPKHFHKKAQLTQKGIECHMHFGSLEKLAMPSELNPCQATKSHSESAVPSKRGNLRTTDRLSTWFLEDRPRRSSQPGRHLLQAALD